MRSTRPITRSFAAEVMALHALPTPSVSPPREAPPFQGALEGRFRCKDLPALLDRRLRLPPTTLGLIGFELEGLFGLSEFIERGTLMADIPYGQAEVDNFFQGSELGTLHEVVSDAAPGPTVVHTFGLGATEYFLRPHEQVRDNPNGDPSVFASWPNAHAVRNAGVADSREIRDAVMIGLHVSSGCARDPQRLLTLLNKACPKEAARAAADVGVLTQQHWSVVRRLSPAGLSLLSLIACASRLAETPRPGSLPHSFFQAMSRGTFSGYFRFLSASDRHLLAKLLLPGADGLSPLQRAAKRPADAWLFGSPYLSDTWVTGADGRRTRRLETHDGPTLKDWYVSIVDPRRFNRDTDLASPVGTRTPGMKKEGLGDLGDIKDYILELRAMSPNVFPATGIPIALMLHYKFLQQVNPRLQQVPFVDGGEKERANLVHFHEIGWLCKNLVDLAKALRDGREPDTPLLESIWERLGTRECIEAHSQDERLPALLDELAHYVQGPPRAGDDKEMARFCAITEQVTRRLSDAYPHIGLALFREDWHRWEAAVQAGPPSSAAADKRTAPSKTASQPPEVNLRTRLQHSDAALKRPAVVPAHADKAATKRRRAGV
jgi:hypothetical protein